MSWESRVNFERLGGKKGRSKKEAFRKGVETLASSMIGFSPFRLEVTRSSEYVAKQMQRLGLATDYYSAIRAMDCLTSENQLGYLFVERSKDSITGENLYRFVNMRKAEPRSLEESQAFNEWR